MKNDPVDNRQYLEFSGRLQKTCDGTKGKKNRKFKPRLSGNKSDRCPIGEKTLNSRMLKFV